VADFPHYLGSDSGEDEGVDVVDGARVLCGKGKLLHGGGEVSMSRSGGSCGTGSGKFPVVIEGERVVHNVVLTWQKKKRKKEKKKKERQISHGVLNAHNLSIFVTQS